MKRLLFSLVVALCAVSLANGDQTIRSLQQTLKDQGFYYGTVTGERSAETTAAIWRYQIRNGLKVTGEINEETTRSLNSSSNSVASTSRPTSKSAATQTNGVRPDASARLSQTSLPPTFSQPARPLETGPSYSASFYQSAPFRVNRRSIAAVQYQLMSRGYYWGRVDGKYGRQTAFALRAFQSSAGLPPTGRLDMETVETLGSSDADLAYLAPASRGFETWMPVRKFKNAKWKVKWKSYERPWGNEGLDEDRQVNREYGRNPYNED